jgi:pimeloyl-ACP methyl ester carboxylesterase
MKTEWQSETFANGIHGFVGGSGSGPPVILLPGWPETAEAFTEIFPALSTRHRTFAIDPPGLGNSHPSTEGYDTKTISKLLEKSLRPVTGDTYHLVAHDVGAWIAYAWAAQFPDSVVSLTLLDAAIPGLGAQLPYPLPSQLNLKLWQFSFNALPELPELLTKGRERELFNWLFVRKATHPERITQARRDHYVECYARPGGMTQGFGYYRSAALSASQNITFGKEKLQMPVLALGGQGGVGANMGKNMEALASNVQGGEIDDSGHYVMEEQPEQVAQKLLEFFRHVEGQK